MLGRMGRLPFPMAGSLDVHGNHEHGHTSTSPDHMDEMHNVPCLHHEQDVSLEVVDSHVYLELRGVKILLRAVILNFVCVFVFGAAAVQF